MKLLLACLCIISSSYFSISQSLSPERIKKIKNCTLRITIDSSDNVGTGFYISESGFILTCWHVVNPALKSAGKDSIKANKIYAENNLGEKTEIGIFNYFLSNTVIRDAITYDFCLLGPLKPLANKVPFLKVGDYDNCNEGQEVYTCGYPLGMPQQFVSKGYISTKYIDSFKINNSDSKGYKNVALLDITLNRGNSGGAIVKFGSSVDEDEVIGIADFIINPLARYADSLVSDYDRSRWATVEIAHVETNKTLELITKTILNMSIGISGCVSVNHFLQAWHKGEKANWK